MFESIKKNKIESGVIVGIFIIVITLIVYYICHALELGTFSIVIALIFSIATAWGSYYYSDKIEPVYTTQNGGKPVLHASISAKWTMRSDRAQNSRTEALNLIRNRKGHLPHIAVVTGEPTPSRLASLAMGTGDVDCVYHFALYELVRAVKSIANDDTKALLHTLITGKRLKDISDLPLDLSV